MTAYVQVTAVINLLADVYGEDAVVNALVDLVSPLSISRYLLNDTIGYKYGNAVSLSSSCTPDLPTERTLRLWCESLSCCLYQRS